MPRTPDTSPQSAARARRAYAENRPVRAALRRGELSIAEVMREQPAGLADHTLFEILLMAHQFGRARLRALNARAIEDNVNLAVTLQLADETVRTWVAHNALPHGRLGPRGTWAQPGSYWIVCRHRCASRVIRGASGPTVPRGWSGIQGTSRQASRG